MDPFWTEDTSGSAGLVWKSQTHAGCVCVCVCYQRHGQPAAGSPQDLVQVADLDVVPGDPPELSRQLALQLQLPGHTPGGEGGAAHGWGGALTCR